MNQFFADTPDEELESKRRLELKSQYLQGFKDGVERQTDEVLNRLKSEVKNIADGRRSLTVSSMLQIIDKVRAYYESKLR